MYDRKARVERPDIPEGRRILVISDIHGNMEYFKGVLELAGFSDEDELIIDGDFLEKGPDSLGVLRYVMGLCARGNAHAVCGNCDDWPIIFKADEKVDEMLLEYVLRKKTGILWEMCNAAGMDPFEIESFTQCKRELRQIFSAEWDFLESLPHAIETENFIFAHSGADPQKPLDEHLVQDFVRCDHLLTTDRKFDKWLIVGHWPVMLYGQNIVCANPIIEHSRKIISIDGACVLKDDGQLNCLIIPHKFSEEFDFVAYDPFPEMTVLDDQEASEKSYYIRWGDSTVLVLERGEEFSRCRHRRTGYEMDILTKYLFTDSDITDCNDCTDYVLPLRAGDVVRVVEKCSRGYFVKHNGVSGWYFGRLI